MSLAAVLGCAALIVGASLLVGQLIWRVCGATTWQWSAGPVGLAALLVAGPPSLHMPGRMAFVAVLVLFLSVAGAVLLVRRPAMRPPLWGLLIAVPTLLLVLVPFAANSRVGLLGVSFNNDMAAHLLLADALRSQAVADVSPLLAWYPLGPHAVAAFVGAGTGVDTDVAFTAFTVALPVLTALAAQHFVRDLAWWARPIVVTLAAMPYLVAAYYAQGAFKEVAMGTLLVGTAVAATAAHRSGSVARFVPVGVLLAGIVSMYGYVGLAWPVAGLGLLALAWAVGAVRADGWRPAARWLLPSALLGSLAMLALLVPQAPRIKRFYEWSANAGIRKDDIGNLAGPIDPEEALGVWLQADFRFPATGWVTEVGVIVVIALLLLGLVRAVRRRELALVTMFVAAVLVWFLSRPGQSPYTVAKALAIAAPFVFLIVGRGAFAAFSEARVEGRVRLALAARGVLVVAGAAVATAAVWSSVGALRYGQVGDRTHYRDLSALRPVVKGGPTLYLGVDDFVAWELRGVRVTQPMFAGPDFALRPEKGWAYGQSYDADTIEPATFDRFTFVVAPRNPAASSMPANFRVVARRGVYDVYRRTGPTPDRQVLEEGQAGATVLDCRVPDGRRLKRRGGTAAVRPPAVSVPLTPMVPGDRVDTGVRLTKGTWDLALRYTSPRAIRLQIGDLDTLLPPAMERVGSVWPAGAVRVARTGTVPLRLTADRTRVGGDNGSVAPTELVLQRRGKTRMVPLADACGKPVDWYRGAR
ncbi:hypothetical protein [Patulibacter americanus]|uniref:hypothetical protein n=1 Tax=Patulibacter americanus TaxID=588672 RepID=UPI0003B6418A|nr:hypothetical protein [Patulibacter americanus]